MSRIGEIVEIVYADGSVGTMTIVRRPRQKKVKKTYYFPEGVWSIIKEYAINTIDWEMANLFRRHMYKGITAVSGGLYMKCGGPLKKINWTMEKALMLDYMWKTTLNETIVWNSDKREYPCIPIDIVSKIHK